MFDPSTSNFSPCNNDYSQIEVDDFDADGSFLWCIDDDTLFYAQGLKHHSAGKYKSVYVTWNENYLLNFVFKTSTKIGSTTLTKVRISIPCYEQEPEEICNMLIMEMNTLLYMKSGRVYFFSSVKSLHKIDWLTGVRCMTTCPNTQFSVIRLKYPYENGENDQKRMLSLEVYKDAPQLGKCGNNEVLSHTYDITFDLENLFNCDWLDETYTITSLITDAENISFLQQLASIGNTFRPQEEAVDLNINQEVHIFTISSNIFILCGVISSCESTPINPQVEEFTIRLLNTYASTIECIQVDCKKKLLMVLLKSGHMDIWYKSKRKLDAIFHCQHEIPNFLDYVYWPTENIFYFTTPEDIIQLRIIRYNAIGHEKECIITETRKSIGGMIACTFVDESQQLICLSINNIFYGINFATQYEPIRKTNENETKYENLSKLYALNTKRIYEIMTKAQIVDQIIEQPKILHNAIEKEFQKQQILALESKNHIFMKIFQCHIEYHVNLPGIEYFENDCVHMRTSQLSGAQTIFCLIFMSLKNNENNFMASIFTASMWYLHISDTDQCLQINIPYDILNKKLCFVVEIPMESYESQCLPKFSIKLITFVNHQYHPICLKFKLNLDINEKTFIHLFSDNIKNVSIFNNADKAFKHLFDKEASNTNCSNNMMKDSEGDYIYKQRYKIRKTALQYAMEKQNKQKILRTLDFNLYYLHQHVIRLNYDESKEILLICSNCPLAIFYIKILLIYAMRDCNDLDVIRNPKVDEIIMNYQCDIEQRSLMINSLQSNDSNFSRIHMHFETLRNIYLKFRLDMYDISR